MNRTRAGEPGVPWTMRKDAGFGTAVESNARYKQLIANGTTGLSVAFDLPTQMGHDSDAPIASGEVGKAGVAIDSIDDMRVLFGGIPLGEVSTSLAIDAPAALLLLLYQLVAEEQGVPADRLTGRIQNDAVEDYIARGAYIFPPEPSLRLIADIFGYCRAEIPKWDIISVSGSGHHMAEAGATSARAIVRSRSARRIWARVTREGDGLGYLGPSATSDPFAGAYVGEGVADDIEDRQAERLAKLRAWRCADRVAATLSLVQEAATGTGNVLYPMREALAGGATVGEVCDALREVWGAYVPAD
ncbi:methylmalonyl-CoA mutase family protein [Streptomyces sp. NPDC058257]|uniref:methylmalonyl-CoA mutase family protein n=1 Tax=Streptomyces sp. NPDC058257 TaxID=3346409 RepID=UPI0036EC4078